MEKGGKLKSMLCRLSRLDRQPPFNLHHLLRREDGCARGQEPILRVNNQNLLTGSNLRVNGNDVPGE